jgi:flagellar motor switch protein FliG
MLDDGTELTSAQKAAAILVAIGKPAAGRLLKFFKQDELKALIEGARKLKTIPQQELEKIVAEFEDEFAEGAGLLDSADTMDTLLNETLSTDEMDALLGRQHSAVVFEEVPPWEVIEAAEAEEVAAFLSGEHPQTAAYVVSNLSSGGAAKMLLLLSKEQRGEVVKRMMSLATISPTAKSMIEDRLRARFMQTSSSKASKGGQAKVVGVLNELDKTDLDAVMAELAAAGAGDLEAIRSQLFSFEDIVSLTQKARVTLFDGIDSDLVTNALRNCDPVLTEAILSAIGARTRRMIEAELTQGSDLVSAQDITKARREIASRAIRMASEGSFALPSAQAAA